MFTTVKAVTSSNIEAIGYNESQSILEVRFKNNTSYLYIGVSKTVWGSFSQSTSIGSSFHKLILGKYISIDLAIMNFSELYKHLTGLKDAITNGTTSNISPKAFEKLINCAGLKLDKPKDDVKVEVRRMKPNPRARM